MYLKRYLYHDVLGKFRNAPYQLTNRSAITLGSGKEVRGGLVGERPVWRESAMENHE